MNEEKTNPEAAEDAGTILDLHMASGDGDEPTLPMNRIVAFIGPYVSIVAGALATWLLTKVHVLSMFDLGQAEVAQSITQVIIFGVTAGITWLGQHKWLNGWQEYEADLRQVALFPPIEPQDTSAWKEPFDKEAANAELAKRTSAGVGTGTSITGQSG